MKKFIVSLLVIGMLSCGIGCFAEEIKPTNVLFLPAGYLASKIFCEVKRTEAGWISKPDFWIFNIGTAALVGVVSQNTNNGLLCLAGSTYYTLFEETLFEW